MAEAIAALHQQLIQLSEPIREIVSKTPYEPPEGASVSVKSVVESLLPNTGLVRKSPTLNKDDVLSEIRKFSMCCALLASAEGSASDLMKWIPREVSAAASEAFNAAGKAYFGSLGGKGLGKTVELGLELVEDEGKKLVVELAPEVFPLLKASIKESAIDRSDEVDQVSAACARAPVAYAIMAAYQFRWFVTQIGFPYLGKLCALVIPCALTSLDHWSPEVKGQGMITFIHLGNNVNSGELGWCQDVILDACFQNIVCSDDIWHLVVEMSVLFAASTQKNNPRSPWFEKLLNEMLGHLERHPRNKERRVAWLEHIDPLLNSVGLILLAHFSRIFPLVFQWIHADDDDTVILVLKFVQTIIKLTWIRNTPYVARLVDELSIIYKEAAMRKARTEIRKHVAQLLIFLRQCQGLQFEAAWAKHKDDPNLETLELFREQDTMIAI
uniref:ARM repeat superfamily protein n=3 Tax=Kalanchoe fedtschenkoi TaxID=63787 RepID=A0A7N0TQ73_KALFE